MVFVAFSLARNGDVQTVSIAATSGDPVLDRAAIDSIHEASPMPAIPVGLPDQLSVMLPIDFHPAKQEARP